MDKAKEKILTHYTQLGLWNSNYSWSITITITCNCNWKFELSI